MSIETRKRTLEFSDAAVTVQVPAGWREAPVGEDSLTFTRPGSHGASVFWVSSTCQGSCATVQQNVENACQTQVDAHQKYYDTVEVVSDEALEDGKRSFELRLQKGEREHQQFVCFHYQASWPRAVMCSFMAIAPLDKENLEQFRAECRSPEIERK